MRKLMEHDLEAAGMGADDVYFCSLSSRTIVYKGQLKPEQVRRSSLSMPTWQQCTAPATLPTFVASICKHFAA